MAQTSSGRRESYQRYVSKLAPCRGNGFFPWHPVRNRLLDLLFEVFANLFRQLFIEIATREQVLKPTHASPAVNERQCPVCSARSKTQEIHDSPGAKTRVIPLSILSKRDTSSSRCVAPFAVSL